MTGLPDLAPARWQSGAVSPQEPQRNRVRAGSEGADAAG
jgi:hypothetical protein